MLASATMSEPGRCAELLTGLGAEAVTTSAAPRGPVTFGLWEPPLTALRGEAGAPVRRTATAEAAGLLADLVAAEVPALAFVRSRRGAEAVAAGGQADAAGGGARRAGRPGRRVPVRLPARGPARAGGGAADRGDHRAGHHDRARARGEHHRSGRRADRGLAGYPGGAVAAGGTGRAGRPGRDGRADRARRSAGHLSGAPSGGDPAPAGRGHRARPGQPVRAGPAPVRGRRRAAADRRGHRAVRRRGRGRGRPAHRARPAAPARPLALPVPARPDRAGQPARLRRAAGADRRGADRPAGRHGGRAVRALPRAHRRGVPAPGRDLPGEPAWTWTRASRWCSPATLATRPRPGS